MTICKHDKTIEETKTDNKTDWNFHITKLSLKHTLCLKKIIYNKTNKSRDKLGHYMDNDYNLDSDTGIKVNKL